MSRDVKVVVGALSFLLAALFLLFQASGSTETSSKQVAENEDKASSSLNIQKTEKIASTDDEDDFYREYPPQYQEQETTIIKKKKHVPSTIPTTKRSKSPGNRVEARPEIAGSYVSYTVKSGDSLYKILRTLHISTARTNMNRIARLNGLSDPGKIKIGQVLKIPKP
jgi:LysM repeat protein